MAESDRSGVAAVFAANAHLHAGARGATERDGHLHELADAALVDACKDIALDDFKIALDAHKGA